MLATRHPIIEADLDSILDEGRALPWDRLRGKTVLVTGANGFLPAYMVETLLRRNELEGGEGTRVLALVRNAERAAARFAACEGRDDLRFLVQDVAEPIQISEQVDFIIHAASQASPKYYGRDPVGTLLPNVQGTQQLLTLARDHEVESFLFFSSGEVYGQVPEHCVPTDERAYGYVDPTDVRSCYAESKRMGETMCVAWRHQYGVPAVIVRPFHTYGPGMRLDDGRVFADFVGNIVEGRDIRMHSDGSARRAFCYLADATLGFFTVLLCGESGQAYNVGNDRQETSIRELAEKLVALFPEKHLKAILESATQNAGYLKSKISRNCPDISKVRALGWEPTTSIEAGFYKTVRSFE